METVHDDIDGHVCPVIQTFTIGLLHSGVDLALKPIFFLQVLELLFELGALTTSGAAFGQNAGTVHLIM